MTIRAEIRQELQRSQTPPLVQNLESTPIGLTNTTSKVPKSAPPPPPIHQPIYLTLMFFLVHLILLILFVILLILCLLQLALPQQFPQLSFQDKLIVPFLHQYALIQFLRLTLLFLQPPHPLVTLHQYLQRLMPQKLFMIMRILLPLKRLTMWIAIHSQPLPQM